MNTLIKINNDLDVELYDSQTYQLLAVISCSTKLVADNLYSELSLLIEEQDIITIFDC